jgi:hypothetical protein
MAMLAVRASIAPRDLRVPIDQTADRNCPDPHRGVYADQADEAPVAGALS